MSWKGTATLQFTDETTTEWTGTIDRSAADAAAAEAVRHAQQSQPPGTSKPIRRATVQLDALEIQPT